MRFERHFWKNEKETNSILIEKEDMDRLGDTIVYEGESYVCSWWYIKDNKCVFDYNLIAPVKFQRKILREHDVILLNIESDSLDGPEHLIEYEGIEYEYLMREKTKGELPVIIYTESAEGIMERMRKEFISKLNS